MKRIPQKGILGGVYAGIAYSLNIKPRALRFVTAALLLFFNEKIIASYVIGYILLCLFVPAAKKEPPDYDEKTQ